MGSGGKRDMNEIHNIVRVSAVTKIFKLKKLRVEALRGVDLEIRSGEYLSIMGPSGSGKSTLFNMIGGLDKPTSGKPTSWPGCAVEKLVTSFRHST